MFDILPDAALCVILISPWLVMPVLFIRARLIERRGERVTQRLIRRQRRVLDYEVRNTRGDYAAWLDWYARNGNGYD